MILVSSTDPQVVAILEERLDEGHGQFADRDAARDRALDHLVIDVGQVHYLVNVPSLERDRPAQQILEEKCAEVAEMGGIVDCWSARIHADCFSVGGGQRLDRPRHRVVKAKVGHAKQR